MFKKFICLSLSLIMILCCFISCNNEKEKEDPANTTTDVTTAADTTATTAATTAKIISKKVRLSEYVIVHTNDTYARNAATYLKRAIKEDTGVTLAMTTEYEQSDSYKILIGNFNLDATNEFFKNDAEYMEKYYQVVFQDNLIVIAAGSEIPAEAACSKLIEKTVSSNGYIEIANEFSFAGDQYDHVEMISPKIDESDIRIVSFNLANYINPESRLQKFYKLMDEFDADILMFQETVGQYNWHNHIDTKLLETYGFAEAPTNDPDVAHNKNYNPIYYKQSKFELINSEWHRFSKPEKDARMYSIAEFKVKGTSKTFSVICSHFSTDQSVRLVNEEELADVITAYQSEHNNAPLFLVGDLNAVKSKLSGKLKKVLKDATDMKDIVKKNTEYGTSCAVTGVWPGYWLQKDGLLIDHALGAGEGYKGKQFQVVASPLAAATSDHVPIIFDFELT